MVCRMAVTCSARRVGDMTDLCWSTLRASPAVGLRLERLPANQQKTANAADEAGLPQEIRLPQEAGHGASGPSANRAQSVRPRSCDRPSSTR